MSTQMSLALVSVLLAGCAGPAARTHHTAPIVAPSTSGVSAEVARAQRANERARDDATRIDAKATVVLKWLER